MNVSAISTDELSHICEAYESAIFDIQVEYQWSVDPLISAEKASRDMMVVLGPTESFWATKRPFTEYSLSTQKIKVTDGVDEWTSSKKQCYNGKRGKYLSSHNKFGTVKYSGTITKSKRFMTHKNLSPFGFTLERFRDDRDDPVSKLLKGKERVVLNTELQKINNFKTISATFFFTYEKKEFAYLKLYFSPEHDYTLVKIEYLKKQKPDLSIEVLELQQVSDGIWFPIKGRISALNDESANLYKATKVMVNKGLTDDFFDFEFPAGTKVIDEIVGLEYIIRPTEE